MISPSWLDAVIVDSEMQSARIGLAGGDGVTLNAELKTSTQSWIKLTEQVAGDIIQIFLKVDPHRECEILRAEL